ncbi:MAG: hypothetical protein ATN31_03845 [Candidatus Epulonipiscioides saccharophilum]|nr:MAG: hypothetical protein ATN31_03845 [Epulopiscium sp. AS2M-Bin001]
MIDKDKIILMSKLAILDSDPQMKQSRKIAAKYSKDFIYVKNLWTQIFISIMLVVIIAIHVLWRIQYGMQFPSSITEMLDIAIPYVIVIFSLIIFYTILSTLVYKKMYRRATMKIAKYDKIMDELKNLSTGEEIAYEKFFAS